MDALDGMLDRLYRVDAQTGAAQFVATVGLDLGTVGLEVLPGSGAMYACTNDGLLYEIDPNSGEAFAIGPIDMPGDCASLAAPRGPVTCLDR